MEGEAGESGIRGEVNIECPRIASGLDLAVAMPPEIC